MAPMAANPAVDRSASRAKSNEKPAASSAESGGHRPRSPQDAWYFAAWTDRMTETTSAYPDWNSAAEKRRLLELIAQAKTAFVGLE